jgi:excisionase family DNA binding protein
MPLVDTGEMAERLGVHERTVRRLAREGKIPCLQLEKEYRFDVEAVFAALERKPDDETKP